jgi:hypothetical protein
MRMRERAAVHQHACINAAVAEEMSAAKERSRKGTAHISNSCHYARTPRTAHTKTPLGLDSHTPFARAVQAVFSNPRLLLLWL